MNSAESLFTKIKLFIGFQLLKMNLTKGNMAEIPRKSLLVARPPLTAKQWESLVGRVTGRTSPNLLAWDSRRVTHQKVLSIGCFANRPHMMGEPSLSCLRAGTGPSARRGGWPTLREGQHVVRGPCQPKGTVPPLRDTKSHCPRLFFSSSNAVRVQNWLWR